MTHIMTRPLTLPAPAGGVDAAKLAEVESICRQFLEAKAPVYGRDVPLAQAKAIRGLRAVFGEVSQRRGWPED
jgi:alanyl-tRNA synthetase